MLYKLFCKLSEHRKGQEQGSGGEIRSFEHCTGMIRANLDRSWAQVSGRWPGALQQASAEPIGVAPASLRIWAI